MSLIKQRQSNESMQECQSLQAMRIPNTGPTGDMTTANKFLKGNLPIEMGARILNTAWTKNFVDVHVYVS